MPGICRTGPAGAETAAVPPRKRALGGFWTAENRPAAGGGGNSAATALKTPKLEVP